MSYRINKTDGSLLVELIDGIIDTSSTDLALVGRNYKGFGERFNENFIQLLENFANSNAPSNPLKGQLWYDTSENRLKIYDGVEFKVASGPIVSPSQPNQFVTGDLWINNEENKLYFWDGTDLVLVGPNYTSGQGKTGLEAYTMVDTGNQTRTVLLLYIGGVLAGILSRQQFTPADRFVVNPYPRGREIKVGFNPVDTINFKFQGTAQAAESLVDSLGTVYSFEQFVRTDERDLSGNVVEQSILGSLFVKGSTGVKIGLGDTDYAHFKVPSTSTTSVIELQQPNTDFAVRVKLGNSIVDAITVDSSAQKVGIFQNSPQTSLDVTGSGRFTGNLTVEGNLSVLGDTSYFNVSTLQIEDKNIELGILSDGTVGNDLSIDNGGLILKSSGGDKEIVWKQTTNSWTSNQNFNLSVGKEYRIDDTSVLTKTKLGDTVTEANGLTSIGTLTGLNISGDLTLTGNINNPNGMNILTGDTITLNNVRLTGLENPSSNADATNKSYVDNAVATIPTSFSLDITGLTNPNPPGQGNGPINDVKSILNTISTVTSANNGSIAKIHCVSYSSTLVTDIEVSVRASTAPNNGETLTKSYISVDSAGTQNESVVQDITSSNTTTGNLTLVASRYTMTFQVSSGTWEHQSTVNYM